MRWIAGAAVFAVSATLGVAVTTYLVKRFTGKSLVS